MNSYEMFRKRVHPRLIRQPQQPTESPKRSLFLLAATVKASKMKSILIANVDCRNLEANEEFQTALQIVFLLEGKL